MRTPLLASALIAALTTACAAAQRTLVENGPDGEVAYRIVEHPRSPQFNGYRLFVTPGTPALGQPLDVSVRFAEVARGNVIAHVPTTRLALQPAETRIVAVRRP